MGYDTMTGNIRLPFIEEDEHLIKTVRENRNLKYSLRWYGDLVKYAKARCKELYEAGEIVDELSCLQTLERLTYEYLQKRPPERGPSKIGLRSFGKLAEVVLKEVFNRDYEYLIHIYRIRGHENPFEQSAPDTFNKTCLSRFYKVVLEIRPKKRA